MTMPHQMNCPHQGEGWCLDCVGRLQSWADDKTHEMGEQQKMIQQLAAENEQHRKHAGEVWGECEARGEILDAIQREAGGGWWYHALYVLRQQAKAIKDRQDQIYRLSSRVERDAGKLAEMQEHVEKLSAIAVAVGRKDWDAATAEHDEFGRWLVEDQPKTAEPEQVF
jgi:hypothetical protein